MKRTLVFALGVLAAAADRTWAQCPDGAPPPCKSPTAVAPRRVSPPLDDHTWIVVPFDNLANNQDVDWLRAGSVNLLYLGMSNWTDVRVIDDERVADYLREVPGAADAKQLTLNTALAVAKRAGAGRLVMGDILKLGAKTTVNAKVFDVRTGQRLRTVRDDAANPDSLMSMFGTLSRKVLNVAPPSGVAVGAVGTSSIGAYREYAEGLQALGRFSLDSAQAHFTRALVVDSTFALAHNKLAITLGWSVPGDPRIRQHAEQAARLAHSLPPREKSLIEASAAFAHADYAVACAGFRGLIRRDSTDTDAWYGLGDCLYHDLQLEPVPGDTTRVRWRASRNASIEAFRRVLALDPSYHVAYQHISDAYLSQSLNSQYCVGQTCAQYIALVRPSGDSLLIVPVRVPNDSALLRSHVEDLLRGDGRRAVLERGVKVTDAWLAANPRETRAMFARSATLLSKGLPAAADSIFQAMSAAERLSGGNAAYPAAEELNIKMWRNNALELYDSLRAHPFTVRGGANPITIGNLLTVAAPVFGQMSLYDSLITLGNRGAPPSRIALSRAVVRTIAGLPADSLPALFTAAFTAPASSGSAGPTRTLGPYLLHAIRSWPSSQWPRLDTTAIDLRTAPVIAIQRGDTAMLRRSAKSLDSLSRLMTAALVPDTGLALAAAEAYLAAHDSLAALRMTRRWLDSVFTYTTMLVGNATPNTALFVPRAMLLRADLAAALGFKDEARLWYRRFLAFWKEADPEFRPLIDRVKRSYDAIGQP